jgi:hypothetical protein
VSFLHTVFARGRYYLNRRPGGETPPPAAASESEIETVAFALFDESDGERVAEITASLRARGVQLESLSGEAGRDGPYPATLVVFVSNALLEDSAAHTSISKWSGDLIPVSLEELPDSLPEAIKERTPLDARGRPADSVSRRISLSVKASPDWLLAWQVLRATAERYEAGGEKRELLSASQLDEARTTVLERPHEEIPSVPPDINRLFDASERAIRRLFRARVRIALSVSGVLALAVLVAVIQRHSALDAAARAGAEARHSEADRLSRLSLADLPSNPDLPVLLARRAYAIDADSQSRQALRRALDAGPWHRSYRLAGTPEGVVGSGRSPLVLVILAEGAVALVNIQTGRTLANAPLPAEATGGLPVASITNSAHRVVLAYNGGLVQVRAMDAAFTVLSTVRLPALRSSESLSVAWLPGERKILSAWGGQPAIVLGPSGTSIRRLGVLGPVDAAAIAEEGSLAALADGQRIAVLRAGTLRPCGTLRDPDSGGGSLVFDISQDTLVMLGPHGESVQLQLPSGCSPVRGERPQEPEWPAAGASAGAGVLPSGTVAFATASGKVVLQVPPATYPAQEFLAADGPVTGVAAADGRLATVGSDGWLRVWSIATLPPVYPTHPAQQIDLTESSQSPMATWRPMIAVNEAGTLVSTGGIATGLIWVGDARDLRARGSSAFIAIDSSIRPMLDSDCAALVIVGAGQVEEVRCHDGHFSAIWHRSSPLKLPMLINSAISPNGRTVALAEPNMIELTNTATGQKRTIPAHEVVSVTFDHANEMIATEGNGTMLSVTASSTRTSPVRLGGQSVQAAGVLPSGEGALLASADGEVTLASVAHGTVLKRLQLTSSLSTVIDVRVSDDGRLALILARDGWWVLDLASWQVIASEEGISEADVGAQPRDGAFVPGTDTLLLLRADEGIQAVNLQSWRFLNGAALLSATADAVPRTLEGHEAEQVSPLPSVGE